MLIDLFGNGVSLDTAVRVNIYSDEIWETIHKVTNETWIYSVAVYERTDSPLLDDLISLRYLKDRIDWELFYEKNDTDVHWAELGGDANKKHIVERWLKFIHDDCFGERKFFFSLIGLNLSNLNLSEFDNQQTLNSIYNRFYRTMVRSSLKKFFGAGVIVDNIFHEQGSQEVHGYFDWHTIFKLDQDENINMLCDKVTFLPKSHRDDPKSNILQLCDVLAGLFKDLHCGVEESNKNKNRRSILDSKHVQDLFVERVIKKPNNINSSYGYSGRFNLSFFPKSKSAPDSIERLMNNYYDLTKMQFVYTQPPQISLF